MKGLLSGIVALAVFGSSWAAIPSEAEVRSAFKEAREINELKSDIDLLDRALETGAPAKCPLSLAHGKRVHSDATRDRRVNDALLATRILMKRGQYTLDDVNHDDVKVLFKRENGDTCDVATPVLPCDFNSIYRRPDGSCNNREHPEWGMAGRSQERFVRNDYGDRLGKPRTKGSNDAALPNPRLVSNAINRNPNPTKTTQSATLTLHSMGFGQFLDHDITSTPETVISDCCTVPVNDDVDNCFSIVIPENDLYQNYFVKDYCMEVKRSAPVKCKDDSMNVTEAFSEHYGSGSDYVELQADLDPYWSQTYNDAHSNGREIRQQINAITAFIDASNVYGSSEDRQKELREGATGEGFLMEVTTVDGNERILDGNSDDCTVSVAGQKCSAGGDHRINEVPSLTSYHYMFVKEHNRIANKIKDFYTDANGVTDDEKIFQETRRILIAILQKITYKEFLPSFLSPKAMSKISAPYQYNPSVNPTILNSFSTAAYRVGHTWVSEDMVVFDNTFKTANIKGASAPTEKTFHDPKMTYLQDAFEGLIFWLSGVKSPETDRVLEDAIRNTLFVDDGAKKAWDLASLNIQRGRDHGLPSYDKYRQACGLPNVKKQWDTRQGRPTLPDHPSDIEEKLKELYATPKDIDLFVGGISEDPVAGGSLGPTFECIIAEQFRRLKFGDRLWYENPDFGFRPNQIKAIDNYSFSRLLCNNNNFNKIQHPNAFLVMPDDQLTECAQIENLDLDIEPFNPNPPQTRVLSLDDRLEELIEKLEEEIVDKK